MVSRQNAEFFSLKSSVRKLIDLMFEILSHESDVCLLSCYVVSDICKKFQSVFPVFFFFFLHFTCNFLFYWSIFLQILWHLTIMALIFIFPAYITQAENRASEAERTVSKLQKEVDRLEGRSLQDIGCIKLKACLWHVCIFCRIVHDVLAQRAGIGSVHFFC